MVQGQVVVVGGGLAGCEAAWQIARAQLPCVLYEMRPHQMTPAHRTGDLAELVCSNSLGSINETNAAGLIKEELGIMGSLLVDMAKASQVPAGKALAVDRKEFSSRIATALSQHPLIDIRRHELKTIPTEPAAVVLATGPLTSPALTEELQALTGEAMLHFYDAAAPLIHAESIDAEKTFRAGRHGSGDYINCPLNASEYAHLVEELCGAERVVRHSFEPQELFAGCLPVEEMARRGVDTLRFGPLRPIGLIDPRTQERPHAVVQLRRDDRAGRMYNMVGFQTNLTWPEQRRIFRLVPGLEEAEFLRYGVMHRNTFLNAPQFLDSTLEAKERPGLFVAGQLSGGEGYVSAIATGLVAGINAARLLQQKPLVAWPVDTMVGSLTAYLAHGSGKTFQPMNPNFGLLPLGSGSRKTRRDRMARRALRSMRIFSSQLGNGGIL